VLGDGLALFRSQQVYLDSVLLTLYWALTLLVVILVAAAVAANKADIGD